MAVVDGAVVIFEDSKGEEGDGHNEPVVLSMHEENVQSMAMTSDGCSVVTADKVGNVVLWEMSAENGWGVR